MSEQVVSFVYADWLSQYPEFGSVTPQQAQGYFNQATTLVDNTPCNPVQDVPTLTTLLYMATAHVTALFASQNGQGPRGAVGRVSDASEGSVSVRTEYVAPTTDIQAYWNQTPYGAQYYAATRKYRTGFYVRAPRGVNANQGFGLGARRFGGPLDSLF